jgi:hypothetical protein
MRLLLTENQLKMLVSEYYDRSQVYDREKLLKALKSAPGHVKSHLKGLPRFYVRDEQGEPLKDIMGNKVIFTHIPEIIYDYLHGNY